MDVPLERRGRRRRLGMDMWEKKAFRIVVPTAVFAALVVLVVLCAAEEKRNVGRMVGIQVASAEGGIELAEAWEGMPAARAGLQGGDLIVAINGEKILTFDDYDAHALLFEADASVHFTVLRDGAESTFEVKPGTPFRYLRFLSEKLGVLLYFVLGLAVLAAGASDTRARLLFLFSIAVAFELAIPEAAFGPVSWTAFAAVMYLMLSGSQMSLLLHLASVIPEPQPWVVRHRWVIPLYYLVGVGFGVLAGLAFVAELVGGRAFLVSSEQLNIVFGIYMLPAWSFAVACILGREVLRHPEPQGRQQAGLVFVGVLPWTAYTLVSTFMPGALDFLSTYADPLQSVILLCYPIAVFLAIFRYNLFDIELVVRRGLVYTSLTIILVALFYAFLALGGSLLSIVTDEASSVWVVSAATLMLGLLFSPLRDAVRATVDRRFFPERYALRHQLIALAEELPALRKLPVMGDYLAERLANIFAVSSVTLLIGDPETGVMSILASTGADRDSPTDQALLVAPEDPGIVMLKNFGRPTPIGSLRATSTMLAHRLKALGTTLVVPVSSRANLIGVLLLGKRAGAERYPAEELELLNLLSHHVATTFENARLFESATYEGLTGLLRRESILEHLKAEVARAQRYDRPLTVGMADLDHFKRVNDTYGHLTGDATLQRIAQTIAQGLRSMDAVGRYGGEEFLFVLPETDHEAAGQVAEKIRHMVEESVIQAEDGSEVKVTVSIGLASLSDMDSSGDIDITDLIAVADSNLFKAKRDGRNRVVPPVVGASG